MKNISATFKGIITGILMVLTALYLFYVAELPVNGRNQFIPLTIFVFAMIWSLLSLKMRSPGNLIFKDYFMEGFKTFIVVTLIMVIYTFIFYRLNPQILETTLKENNALILKEGNHTPAEIEANSNKLREIFMPMMLAINTIKYLIIGSMISLLGAAIFSQKKN